MPHSINEVQGDFADILTATRHLRDIGFVYKRMHFNDLEAKDPTEWVFNKSHLERFQELVSDAAAIRKQKKAWEDRAQEWGIAPEASQQTSKTKQDETQTSSTKKR